MNITRDEFDAVMDGMIAAFLTLPEDKRTEQNIERIFETMRAVLPRAVLLAQFPSVKP